MLHLTRDAASHPGKEEISITPPWKPQTSIESHFLPFSKHSQSHYYQKPVNAV
jgi:hypothetical protein